ncbi:manganese-binding protein [Mariprofundus erugo]|uniref:Manganese-binding protein n=1 Tax=Mariprofundus erugo TaxID=2528639 RepID=A0A5R9GWY6_9PROT|nr:zinc ABC transporter substrate-binding protein [Mariprofundus erugo]TLS68693.1 manganese-binding protein [Mariprofundus erugo]
MRACFSLLRLLLLGALFSGALPAVASATTVAVTLPPLAGLVSMLDERAELFCLLPAGADPHHFQMQPRMVERLRKSDLFIRASRDDGGWPLLAAQSGVLDLWPQRDHGWVSPAEVRRVLPEIAQALISREPASEARIRSNLAQALAQVTQIEQLWRQQLQSARQTGVMMQHPAWGHLLDEMGVPVLAVLESGHHGHEYGPHMLEDALTKMHQHPGVWLLGDRGHDSKALDWLAAHAETPAHRVTLDVLGQCGVSWPALMQENIDRLHGQ